MKRSVLSGIMGMMIAIGISAASEAATLESPANGANLSGLGFISGWKCDAGEITVTINDGGHIPMATGQPRDDTRLRCGTTDNGFISQVNWNHLSDGTHTAVAYDDGEEFARSTFTVVTAGEEFIDQAPGTAYAANWPSVGENARLVWNESTQHFELAEVGRHVIIPDSDSSDPNPTAVDLGACAAGMRVMPGQSCSGYQGRDGYSFTFSVDRFTYGCIEIPDENVHECEATEMYSAFGTDFEIQAERNPDGSWTIEYVADSTPDDHGDTRETATPITAVVGDTVMVSGQFYDSSDEEWFAITVPAGVRDGVLTVQMTGGVFAFGRLYQLTRDGTLNEIANDGKTSGWTADFQLTAVVSTGTYYLRSWYFLFAVASNTPYTLDIGLSASGGDGDDNQGDTSGNDRDDTHDTAIPVTAVLNDSVSVTGQFERAGQNVEWFAVTVPPDVAAATTISADLVEGPAIECRIHRLTSNGVLHLMSGATWVPDCGIGVSVSIFRDTSTEGTYYIEIRPSHDVVAGTAYLLDISLHEPNPLPPDFLGSCRVGLRVDLQAGEHCVVSVPHPHQERHFIGVPFGQYASGPDTSSAEGCLYLHGNDNPWGLEAWQCDEARLDVLGFAAHKNDDGSWTITAVPH